MKTPRFSRYFCTIVMAGFLLGIHNGKIALWEDNNPEPVKVFPYSARILPPEARAALEKGYPIDSMEQLEQMVRDYLS